MVIEQIIDENHVRHYSDNDMKIRQIETNIIYDDAVDVTPCRYTYEEINQLIYNDEDLINEKGRE